MVHFDRSGHFGRSDRNVSLHLTKLLSPVPQESPKAILTGRPIFLGEEVAAHLGHQACRLPSRGVAFHVRVKQLLN